MVVCLQMTSVATMPMPDSPLSVGAAWSQRDRPGQLQPSYAFLSYSWGPSLRDGGWFWSLASQVGILPGSQVPLPWLLLSEARWLHAGALAHGGQ